MVDEDSSISNARKNSGESGAINMARGSTKTEYQAYVDEESALGRKPMGRTEWEKSRYNEENRSSSSRKNKDQDDCFSTLWREDPVTRRIKDNIANYTSKNDASIDSDIKTGWDDLYRYAAIRQYDPLTLDLNGNGIETLASNGHKGALFDHDKDGIRTATGWVGKDDGFLVYDRNGDGVVNNGGELFGDNTLLKNGERAANGYQALADLDENGDGKVDAADSAFTKLRVWRDLNQDGISQEGELLTLDEAKVKALNLANKNTDRDLGNGNSLAEEGTYTDSDGNEKQMGDLNLAADPFHSRFSDSVPLTDEQQQAPNLRGSGRVRDLREAAAQSPDVAAALQAYANAQTKEEQLALRDQLLRAWAGTDKRFTTEGVLKAASKDFVMASNGKNKGNAIPLTPGEIHALGTIEGPSIWSLLGIEDPDKKKKAALHEKIGILDAFTGTDSTHLYYGTKAQAQHTLDTIEKTYANLADNLYDGLLFQTRLKPYLNAIRFGMSEDGKLQLDYSGVAALFDEVHAKNPGKAFTDLGELLAKGNADGKNTDMAPLAEKFVQYAQEASNNGTLEAYSNTLGKEALATLGHSIGTDNDDTLRGNNSANYLYGGKGNDSLYGNYGNDGKDTLNGGSGDDYMEGGDNGSDTYLFQAGHGKDTIADKAYKDKDADILRFEGAKAADARFSREGRDLVVNAYGSDSDRVSLRNYFYSDDDRRFHFQFDGQTLGMADIAKQAFAFSGSASDDYYIKGWVGNDTIHGLDGDDSISGREGDDTLHGDAGDDILSGDEGNDTLNGGAGDDTLHGGTGDDTLNGGTGNDSLYGNEGKDTYLFQAGHGKDAIAEKAYEDKDADILRFEGAKAADARFSREGRDLVVNAYGSDSDRVSLKNYFYSDDYRRFHFQFGDKALEMADIAKNAFTVTGTDGNDAFEGWVTDDTMYGGAGSDSLSGGAGNDTLAGGDGNDSLYGGEGHDTLNGGSGDDYLEGGDCGSDTYLFQAGHGKDTIVEKAYEDKDADILRFEGAKAADARFSREGRDLVVNAYGSDSDRVSLRNYFYSYSDDYRRFHFQFGDQSLEMADIAKQAFEFSGSSSSDYIDGWVGNDTVHGLEGDDSISGHDGDDTLNGGAGDDTLRGGTGDDTLNGGTGNDSLYGNEGKDTYLFQAGHGKDAIAEKAYEDKDADILRFEGAKAADARFSREGRDLVVNAYGSDSDRVSLKNYFYSDNYSRYNFHFDDATFKAAELRGKDLPTEGLKAPVAATAQADAATPDSATAAVTPQEKAAATATTDDSKAQVANTPEKIVAVDTFHPPLQLHKDGAASTDAVQKADSATVSGNDAGGNARAVQTSADTKVQSAATDTATQAAVPASGKATQIVAATSVDSRVASKADTQSSTVQQNAAAVDAALKTGGATATPASTLDAKAAQQSQQMLSAMATQSQTATPTALAAPDLQPKPQLVASQV